MTDELPRDPDSQPDSQPDSPPRTPPDAIDDRRPSGRGRFGGLAGRFRRRQTEQTPPHDSAPIEDVPTEGSEEQVVPTPAIRPSASTEETDQTSAEADASDSPDDSSPDNSPERAIPHPELHPALRRDTPESARAESQTDAQAASDQRDAGDDDNAAPGEDRESAVAPVSPVIEERIAVTPRPVPPAIPTTPTVEASRPPGGDEGDPSSPPGYDEEADQSDVPALSRRLTGISAHLTVLTGVAMAVVLAFILIEPTPRWFLILGAGAVILGLDGTLRETWREPFAFGQETAPFLFVPALFMLSVPVLIEHNFQGEVVVLAGIGAGLAFGSLAWAELASVRSFGSEYPQARILVTANTYLVGFAIFSLTYVYAIPLPAAIAACGIAAGMLAVEVLREGEIDPAETLGLSLVAAVVIAEARWLFYYAPLDTYLAGLTLLLVFYLLTGLLHSYVVRALSAPIAAQYGGIAAAGLALVIIARTAGLA